MSDVDLVSGANCSRFSILFYNILKYNIISNKILRSMIWSGLWVFMLDLGHAGHHMNVIENLMKPVCIFKKIHGGGHHG